MRCAQDKGWTLLKWNLGEYGTSSELGKRNRLPCIAKPRGAEIVKEGRSPRRELQPKVVAWGKHCLESLVDYRGSGILTSLCSVREGDQIRYGNLGLLEVLTNHWGPREQEY